MGKATSWMTGAILGGLIGSVLALLFTPVTGYALISTIKGHLQNVLTEVELAGEEKRAELEDELNSLRSGKI